MREDSHDMGTMNPPDSGKEVSGTDAGPAVSEARQDQDHSGDWKEFRPLLEGLQEPLASAVAGREEDFLFIGGRVGEFVQESMALSDRATEVAACTGSEEMEELGRALLDVLSELTSICDLNADLDVQSSLVLVADSIRHLEGSLVDMAKIVRSMDMLGIATRIESARLGSDGYGFATLADDVESLAENISEHSSQLRERASLLDGYMATAMERAKAMAELQYGCVAESFSKARGDVESLRGLTRNAEDFSKSLLPKARALTEMVGRVVQSLQFHDITKQQVEHVESAVADVLELLDREGEEKDLAGWIGDVCRVQVDQLGNARRRFVSAVEELRENLGSIADHVHAMASDVRSVARGDSLQEGSVLDSVETSVSQGMESLRVFTEQGAAISRSMERIEHMVSDMGSFLDKIEDVGAEIQLISLNANIKAAHTGDKGRALGVLALSIQRMSQDACTLSDATAAALREILASVDRLKEKAASFPSAERLDAMIASLEESIQGLKRINDRVSTSFEYIDLHGDNLGRDIRSLGDGIAFHHDVDRILENVERELAGLGERAHEAAGESGGHERAARLEELLSRYTMEAERLVHEGAMGAEQGEAVLFPEGEAEAARESGQEDWDNVELF